MLLTEIHNININNHLFKEADDICFKSKNLYNKTLYIVRQEFINSSKTSGSTNYLNYNTINKLMISSQDVDYKCLPTRVSNHTLMLLDKNWSSFFKSIKDWKKNPSKYKGKPNLPNYLRKKSGRYVAEYELGAISKKKLKEGIIKLSGTNIEVPFINKDKGTLKCVRVVPTPNNMIKIEIIYEVEEVDLKLDKNNILSIDLGISNLMTLTSNVIGFQPIIINGRILKGINQFYNKSKAEMQSDLPKDIHVSKRIKRLTLKRENLMRNESHKVSKFIIDLCKKFNIGNILIGKNEGWKQDINLGGKTNQNFVGIPYNSFIEKIVYKGLLCGISVKVVEESYTSKASFLDLDILPVYKKGIKNELIFSGKRVSRGIYKSADGRLINADVNGSYNIMRKELIDLGKDLSFDMIEGLAVVPVRVKSTNDYHSFLC